jgi:hypothetical protein
MKRNVIRICMSLALGVLSIANESAGAPFDTLMRKVPDGANCLVLVNVAQILDSEFARSHGSQQKLAAAFEERSVLIPPNATRFVLAAELDLERQSRKWEAAVIELKDSTNFAAAARKTNGKVETIGGLSSVGTSRAFFLDLGDKSVGVLLPSNRQNAARWAQQVKKGGQPLSSYLAEVGAFGDTVGTDIILAVDLTDVFPQEFLSKRLKENEALKGRTADVNEIATLLAGVQGVRLGIKIGAKCTAKLVVDLKDDPSVIADVAKPLILSALKNSGLMLEDVEQWKLSIGSRTISLGGFLSDDGLRRVMGVVEVPVDPVTTIAATQTPMPTPSTPQATPESLIAETSRNYFRSIDKELNSLRLQHSEAKTFGQVALWIDNAARRIDRMSTLNVDDGLADYGGKTASALRQIVASLKGIGIQSGGRGGNVYNDDSSYYDDGNQDAARQVRAEEKAAGALSAQQISQQIADQSAMMRRKMTSRYKIAF